jgi:hypothetical protein
MHSITKVQTQIKLFIYQFVFFLFLFAYIEYGTENYRAVNVLLVNTHYFFNFFRNL